METIKKAFSPSSSSWGDGVNCTWVINWITREILISPTFDSRDRHAAAWVSYGSMYDTMDLLWRHVIRQPFAGPFFVGRMRSNVVLRVEVFLMALCLIVIYINAGGRYPLYRNITRCLLKGVCILMSSQKILSIDTIDSNMMFFYHK